MTTRQQWEREYTDRPSPSSRYLDDRRKAVMYFALTYEALDHYTKHNRVHYRHGTIVGLGQLSEFHPTRDTTEIVIIHEAMYLINNLSDVEYCRLIDHIGRYLNFSVVIDPSVWQDLLYWRQEITDARQLAIKFTSNVQLLGKFSLAPDYESLKSYEELYNE